jgi:hypothetical protein
LPAGSHDRYGSAPALRKDRTASLWDGRGRYYVSQEAKNGTGKKKIEKKEPNELQKQKEERKGRKRITALSMSVNHPY